MDDRYCTLCDGLQRTSPRAEPCSRCGGTGYEPVAQPETERVTTRAASGGDSTSDCLVFDVIKEVANTLISLGISVPEGNEEKAARANDLIRQLCQGVRDHLAVTRQAQEVPALVWDAFGALEDTPFGEHASAKHFIRPYLQGGDVLGWRMVDGIRVFGIVPASGLLPRQEFVRYDDHLATLAESAASGGLNEPFGNPEQFDVNEPSGDSGQLASLEQRARELERFGRAPAGSVYLLAPMSDGYWTPWHIAQKALDDITAALANQQGVGGG